MTLHQTLNQVIVQTQDAGREIYYAISLLESNNPARANLILALEHLGIRGPAEVGLSDSVLRGKNRVSGW